MLNRESIGEGNGASGERDMAKTLKTSSPSASSRRTESELLSECARKLVRIVRSFIYSRHGARFASVQERERENFRILRIRAEKSVLWPLRRAGQDDGVTATRQERRIPRETGSSGRVPSFERASPPRAVRSRPQFSSRCDHKDDPPRWLEVITLFPRALRRDYEADPEIVGSSDLCGCLTASLRIRCFVGKFLKSALCWIDLDSGFVTRFLILDHLDAGEKNFFLLLLLDPIRLIRLINQLIT